MASEWARKKAEELTNREREGHREDCGVFSRRDCDCDVLDIAAALDEARAEGRAEALGDAIPLKDLMAEALAAARAEGEQRERWECHREVQQTIEDMHEQDESGLVGMRWALQRLAARGPMRGPEE